ncbi:MAG: hypothetical protein AAFN30_18610, partial [Actinomycetota bacterium]
MVLSDEPTQRTPEVPPQTPMPLLRRAGNPVPRLGMVLLAVLFAAVPVLLWSRLAPAGDVVAGNEIGANTQGIVQSALPNTNGIVIVTDAAPGESTNNTIGLPVPFGGNIIAGNAENGILIRGAETQSNVVQNNLIGDVDGTGLLEN